MQLDLSRAGLRCGDRLLPGHLLPLLLAALLQARQEGLATAGRPCSRADLRGRIAGWPELHRTQLWRALGRLEDAGLAGLVRYRARSSGPYWLDAAVLGRCEILIDGAPLGAAPLHGLLARGAATAQRGLRPDPPRAAQTDAAPATQPAGLPLSARTVPPGSPAPAHGRSGLHQLAEGPPPLGYVAALAEADFLLDRGELYPARHALASAQRHLEPGDTAAAAALSIRRARIARRLSDWAALRDELRELAAIVTHGRMSDPVRQHWRARMQVLRAWHLYGSLGYAAAALTTLDDIDPAWVDADPATRSEYFNLRGIVLRELAIGQADPRRAAASVACLGHAIHGAALAGMPDQLQIGAANLANTLSQLLEAGLMPACAGGASAGAGDANPPAAGHIPAHATVRWLLLSESICARRDIARNSLLNIVFLLRLASAHSLAFAEVAGIAREVGLPFEANGFADLARRTWSACSHVHSQIPADQRAAFLFMWAHHAAREHDYVGALDLCAQVTHQSRKLRDAGAQQRYAGGVATLRAQIAQRLSPDNAARARSTDRRGRRGSAKPV